jgi:cell division protein ZapA (FtsZ GTPase activity inhibitor)
VQDPQPTPDLLSIYVVPLLLALLGIGGIAVGAWIAARSALRSRLIDLNVKEAESERAFGVRAVAVVTDLGIATHHLIEDLKQRSDALAKPANGQPVSVMLELDSERTARVAELTDRWRGVMAEAQFHTAGDLAKAFYAFDAQREVVVTTVNAAHEAQDLVNALRECATWREYHARQIYRLLQVDKVKGRARVYRLAHVYRLHHFAKTLDRALAREMLSGDQLVQAAARRHEGQQGAASEPGPA